MANPVDLPYHRQNTKDYCGPACAQMVLRGLGVPFEYQGAPVEGLRQVKLFEDAHQTWTGETWEWSSYPDGLTVALNRAWKSHIAAYPPDPGTRFALHICDSHAGLTSVLRQTFEHPRLKAAPIVLGLGGAHWIVTRGYEPLPPAPPGQVNGWYVYNPFPVITGANEWTDHRDGDRCTRLDEDQTWFCSHMSAGYWQQKFVTPVARTVHWRDKLLAICQIESTAAEDLIKIPIHGGAPYRPPRSSGTPEATDVVLLPDEMRRIANELPTVNSFDSVSCVLFSLLDTVAGTPLLVNGNPGDTGEAYYIVPFYREGQTGAAQSQAAVMVIFDAVTGAYQESVSTPGRAAFDTRKFDPAVVRENAAAAGNRLEPAADGAQPFRAVWQPSNESRTRFLPFFVAEKFAPLEPSGTPAADFPLQPSDGPDARPDLVDEPRTVFIRLDGQEFPALTDPKP